MRPLFFLFWIYPLIELWLLIRLGALIGAGGVVLLVVGTGLLGLSVLRRAGWQTLAGARDALAPQAEVTDGFLLASAGLLLVLPGLITDGLGLFMLLPATRRGVIRRLWGPLLRARGPGRGQGSGAGPGREPHRPEIIEGEFRRED